MARIEIQEMPRIQCQIFTLKKSANIMGIATKHVPIFNWSMYLFLFEMHILNSWLTILRPHMLYPRFARDLFLYFSGIWKVLDWQSFWADISKEDQICKLKTCSDWIQDAVCNLATAKACYCAYRLGTYIAVDSQKWQSVEQSNQESQSYFSSVS